MTTRSPRHVVPLCLLLAAALGAAMLAPSSVRAETRINRPFTGQRLMDLDLHAGFAYWGIGFAAGGRFGIPILDNGFVPSLNNAVYINFGADFYFVEYAKKKGGDAYGPGFGIPITLHWEFYFADAWSAFAEVGGNPYFDPGYLRGDRKFFHRGGAFFIAAVGGRFHINRSFGLVLRVGSPYTSFGITLSF